MRILNRRAHAIVAMMAAAMVLATIVVPVTSAATPQMVTIVSHVTFNQDAPNTGDFVASGPAVDNGVICPSGTFVDTGIHFAGFQSPRGVVQLQVGKEFTCDDGSGTFLVKLQIQANFNTGFETFNWVVTGGAGSYGALRGSGNGSTVPNPPTGNINTYHGFFLH